MKADLLADAESIARFLSNYLTNAGVADPKEERVLSHSYTTEFFAWLCALLYRHGFGDEWAERASRAVDAALDAVSDERKRARASDPAHHFHWEFKNLALINVERLIGDQLSESLATRLRQELLNWRNLNVDSTNWTAMRALAYQMRYIRFGHVVDRWRSWLELSLVLSQQTPEGFFPDRAYSHSMQYHAYVLSLLALYCRLTQDKRVRGAFLRGVHLVADFVDPAGDFNYYGRGQRQLFGYASLILALSEAITLCANPAEAGRYQTLNKRVAQFVREHRGPDGVFPVVLSHAGGRWGWYDYNNHGDYLAFSSVWFLLAAAALEGPTVVSHHEDVYTRCYPGLGLAVVAQRDWFAAFAAGGDDLSEPVGLVHLWPTGPFCLGGPEPARAMGIDYQRNYFGPLVYECPVLQRQRGRMSADADAIRISFALPRLEIRQTFDWSDGLSMEQTLEVKRGRPTVTALLASGASLLPGSLKLKPADACPSPAGLVTQSVSEPLELARSLTARAQLVAGQGLSGRTRVDQSTHRRSLRPRLRRRILKAIWVSWVQRIKI